MNLIKDCYHRSIIKSEDNHVVLVKTYRQSKDAVGLYLLVERCRRGIFTLAAMLVNKCLPSEKMPIKLR